MTDLDRVSDIFFIVVGPFQNIHNWTKNTLESRSIQFYTLNYNFSAQELFAINKLPLEKFWQ